MFHQFHQAYNNTVELIYAQNYIIYAFFFFVVVKVFVVYQLGNSHNIGNWASQVVRGFKSKFFQFGGVACGSKLLPALV